MVKINKSAIASLSLLYSDIQEKVKELNAEKAEIKAKMFAYFDSTDGVDSKAEVECGDGFKFAREVRESKRIDEGMLKDALDPKVWTKVTVSRRNLDETKLRKAVANGLVKKSTVKGCVEVKETFAFTHPKSKQEEE